MSIALSSAHPFTLTREEAVVAVLRVLFAQTERTVVALWNPASSLVQQLHQSPPPSEIHPELKEEVTIRKVVVVGDCDKMSKSVRLGKQRLDKYQQSKRSHLG